MPHSARLAWTSNCRHDDKRGPGAPMVCLDCLRALLAGRVLDAKQAHRKAQEDTLQGGASVGHVAVLRTHAAYEHACATYRAVFLTEPTQHRPHCDGTCDEGRECWRMNLVSPEEAQRRGIELLDVADVEQLITSYCTHEDNSAVRAHYVCNVCRATLDAANVCDKPPPWKPADVQHASTPAQAPTPRAMATIAPAQTPARSVQCDSCGHYGTRDEVKLHSASGINKCRDADACANRCMAEAAPLPPIDMVLFCPRCGSQHLDKPDPAKGWTNPPHRSHLCAACGLVWRPADVPTNGVLATKTRGKGDTVPA
jgi:hypothetical protein